jgi:hypothetical protein
VVHNSIGQVASRKGGPCVRKHEVHISVVAVALSAVVMFAPTTLAQTFSSSRAFTSASPVAKPHGDRRLHRLAATISATSSASPSATASSTALAKNGDPSLAPAVS